MVVPTAGAAVAISVRCYRGADYTGTLPTMVIKQPGQADRTTTDSGSAATWNTLTDTFTPAATPACVIVELQSLNTATEAYCNVYFDAPVVS